MKKILAFTLAETLMTLGIIGVVASLTLPTVMMQYRNKVYVTQLQKVYNQFSNAAVQKMNDEKTDKLGYTDLTSGSEGIGNFFKEYFKVIVDCGNSKTDDNNCFAPSYKSLDNSLSSAPGWRNWTGDNFYCVRLNTSASICMNKMDYDSGSLVVADVNGPSGPNIGGRDLFSFRLLSDGTITGYDGEFKPSECETKAGDEVSAKFGAYCIDKVIYDDWKMDY